MPWKCSHFRTAWVKSYAQRNITISWHTSASVCFLHTLENHTYFISSLAPGYFETVTVKQGQALWGVAFNRLKLRYSSQIVRVTFVQKVFTVCARKYCIQLTSCLVSSNKMLLSYRSFLILFRLVKTKRCRIVLEEAFCMLRFHLIPHHIFAKWFPIIVLNKF